MQITVFSIIFGLFLLFALSRAYLRFRDGTISFRQFVFWLILWGGAGYIFLFPQNTSSVASRLGVGRGADVVVYISIIILFYLAFRIYAAINVSQHETTRLVRAIALEQQERESITTKK